MPYIYDSMIYIVNNKFKIAMLGVVVSVPGYFNVQYHNLDSKCTIALQH